MQTCVTFTANFEIGAREIGKSLLHLFFLAADDIGEGNYADDDPGKRNDSQRPADAMKKVAESVGAYSKHSRPSDTASGIVEQKLRPVIFVDAREQRRENS